MLAPSFLLRVASLTYLLQLVTQSLSAPTPLPFDPDSLYNTQQHPLSLSSPSFDLPPLEDISISTLLSLLAYPNRTSSTPSKPIDNNPKVTDKPILTSLELTRAYLTRINDFKDLNAIIHVNPNAQKEASQADRIREELYLNGEYAIGEELPLDMPLLGIPFLVKDNIAIPATSGPTTAGSFALLNSTVKNPSTVVQRLLDAGAVLLGTTNMDEFAQAKGDHPWAWSALGGQMHSIYGPSASLSSSSFDLALSEGYGDVCGSSGGSALSVALGLAAFALGTQTGVSIVCPSGRGGVVGFKPGRGGMTPMSGVVPISKHLDVVGPIGRTVKDVERIWKVIKHPKGWKEPESEDTEGLYHPSGYEDYNEEHDNEAEAPSPLPNRPIRIGIPKKGIWDDLEEDTPSMLPTLARLVDSLQKDNRFEIFAGKEIVNLTSMTSNVTRGAISIITTHELKLGINHYLSDWTIPPSSSNDTNTDTDSIRTLSDIISFNLAHPSLELPPGPFEAFGHPPQPDESYADQSFLLKSQSIEVVGWANVSYREAKMVVEQNGWEDGLKQYFWGEEGVDVLLLPTEGLSGTLASLSAVPDITLPLSYYPNYTIESNATWPLYPYPQMPYGVSLLASRVRANLTSASSSFTFADLQAQQGHDSHELLLHVAAMVEELVEIKQGERRSMMRDSVRMRLEGLQVEERARRAV